MNFGQANVNVSSNIFRSLQQGEGEWEWVELEQTDRGVGRIRTDR